MNPTLNPEITFNNQLIRCECTGTCTGHNITYHSGVTSVVGTVSFGPAQEVTELNEAWKNMRHIAVGMRRTAADALGLWEGEAGPLSEEDQLEVKKLLQEICDTTWPIPGFTS
ncbi:hypothetical protein ACFQT0_19590 [Hymenobacter humi]|uniref:Uncharacterized protein n=1 Tax=Hymenobacter humi TaxID=1411620 RepID=A0ABW2U724_9BACT